MRRATLWLSKKQRQLCFAPPPLPGPPRGAEISSNCHWTENCRTACSLQCQSSIRMWRRLNCRRVETFQRILLSSSSEGSDQRGSRFFWKVRTSLPGHTTFHSLTLSSSQPPRRKTEMRPVLRSPTSCYFVVIIFNTLVEHGHSAKYYIIYEKWDLLKHLTKYASCKFYFLPVSTLQEIINYKYLKTQCWN